MSTEQHDALVKAGISPDQVVISSVKKVMERFAERFHRGDSIGYAYGLHHDTDNLHVHVALCPRSAKGRYVGCSMSRHPGKHKNQMVFMREWFERENHLRAEFLSNPQKMEQSLSARLDQEKLVIVPRLSPHQRKALRSDEGLLASHLRWTYEEILAQEAAIAEKKRQLAMLRAARGIRRLFGVPQNVLLNSGEKLGAASLSGSLREMQKRLTKMKAAYRLRHQEYCKRYGSDFRIHQGSHSYGQSSGMRI
jgi:hypothetical protein